MKVQIQMENFKKDQNSRWPLIWPFAERLREQTEKWCRWEEKNSDCCSGAFLSEGGTHRARRGSMNIYIDICLSRTNHTELGWIHKLCFPLITLSLFPDRLPRSQSLYMITNTPSLLFICANELCMKSSVSRLHFYTTPGLWRAFWHRWRGLWVQEVPFDHVSESINVRLLLFIMASHTNIHIPRHACKRASTHGLPFLYHIQMLTCCEHDSLIKQNRAD